MDSLRLGQQLWRTWANPISTVVAEGFFGNIPCALNFELAEHFLSEPRQKFRLASELGAFNALDDSANTTAADEQIWHFEREEPAIPVVDGICSHPANAANQRRADARNPEQFYGWCALAAFAC
jgi:hypothetical protein